MQLQVTIDVPENLVPDDDNELIAAALGAYEQMLDALLIADIKAQALTPGMRDILQEARQRSLALAFHYNGPSAAEASPGQNPDA